MSSSHISRRSAFAKLLLGGTAFAAFGRAGVAHADTYTYDALGRLATVTRPNGAVVTYAYDAAGNRTSVVSAPPAAPSGTFSASPSTIILGQSTTLSWTSANATSASIDNGVGSVTPVAGGSVVRSPTTTTTYTLTLTGPGGSTPKTASVTVLQPPTSSISASPSTINAGQSTTLSWTSTNATSASISGIGSVATSGSMNVSPGSTTTYTLTVNGPAGSHNSSAGVTVIQPISINANWGFGPWLSPTRTFTVPPGNPGSILIDYVFSGFGSPTCDHNKNGTGFVPGATSLTMATGNTLAFLFGGEPGDSVEITVRDGTTGSTIGTWIGWAN